MKFDFFKFGYFEYVDFIYIYFQIYDLEFVNLLSLTCYLYHLIDLLKFHFTSNLYFEESIIITFDIIMYISLDFIFDKYCLYLIICFDFDKLDLVEFMEYNYS